MQKTNLIVILTVLILSPAALSLTLQQSIDLALKNNPAVKTSRNNLEAASAKLNQAVGSFFPTIKVDGNLGRSYTAPSDVQITTPTSTGAVTQTFIFGTDEVADMKSLTTSLSQPIFVAALWPGYKIAQRSLDIARSDLNMTIQNTTYDVMVAFYGLLTADKYVQLSEDSLNMAQSHLKQVTSMLNNGVATKADLLRAEVQVANSEVALTRAKNQLILAKNSLNNVLGNDLDQEVNVVEPAPSPLPRLPEYKTLFNYALNYRPDWLQFIYSKQIAEENLNVARTGYLPTVFLNGQTGNQIIEYPSYKSDVNSWSIMGIASWTLFDGLNTQNRINEAAANLEAQKSSEEQVKNGIALDVKQAYLELKTVLETLDSAKKAVDSAEESYKVSSQRFNSGVGTNLEVIDAQVALTQERINYLKTHFDLEIAKAKINKAVGKEVI